MALLSPKFATGKCVVLAKTGGAPDMYVTECTINDEHLTVDYTLIYFDSVHSEFKYVVLPEAALTIKPEKQ